MTQIDSSPIIDSSPVIDLDDVFVIYRGASHDVAALRGMSLRVERGERVVIHGPSGAGKSTFVKLVTAAIAPNAGSARLFGRELSALDRHARDGLRRASIGIITQHSGDDLAPELTCEQNVALQPRLGGSSRAGRRAAFLEALDAVGVGHLATCRPGTLSHGELQRVGIAVAIANRPQLLVADEPTGQLDVANADAMLDLLAALASEYGATLIVATHDEAAAKIADRVITISDGRLSEERRSADSLSCAVVDERGWLRLSQSARDRAHVESRAIVTVADGAITIVAPPGDIDHSQTERPAAAGSTARSTVGVVSVTEVGAPAGEIVRTVRDVSQRFGDTEILRSVSMTVRRSELHAVVGRSGSGKSTLLAILSGWMRPSSGAIEDGDVGESDVPLGVAICPAVPAFPDGLSVREVLDLTRRIQGRSPDHAADDVLLHSLGLDDLVRRAATELSGGERQRLGIVRCLVSCAGLMLFDEPTAQLDRRNARSVINVLIAASTRAAVVCATHDVELIRRAHAVTSLEVHPD